MASITRIPAPTDLVPGAADPCAPERERLRRAQADLDASEAEVDRARQSFDLILARSRLPEAVQALWRQVVLGKERLPRPPKRSGTEAPREVREAARRTLRALDRLVQREGARDAARAAVDACLAQQVPPG